MSLVLDGYLVLQFRKCWGTEMALTELCAIYLFFATGCKKKLPRKPATVESD